MATAFLTRVGGRAFQEAVGGCVWVLGSVWANLSNETDGIWSKLLTIEEFMKQEGGEDLGLWPCQKRLLEFKDR